MRSLLRWFIFVLNRRGFKGEGVAADKMALLSEIMLKLSENMMTWRSFEELHFAILDSFFVLFLLSLKLSLFCL